MAMVVTQTAAKREWKTTMCQCCGEPGGCVPAADGTRLGGGVRTRSALDLARSLFARAPRSW